MEEEVKQEVVEEVKEEVKKEVKKEKKKKSLFRTIFSIIFWTAFALIAGAWLNDYLNVRANKQPSFCISKKTHTFDDGTVDECVGLGYKVYDYKRSSMVNGVEFVPFFANMRESSK